MRNCTAWRSAALIAIVISAFLGGCATGPDSRRFDVEGLTNAIALDDAGYVRTLIQSRALHPNDVVPAPGYAEGTPLITIAAKAGAIEVTRLLIGAGANVNARTPAGETALMLASYFFMEAAHGNSTERHERVARMLVDAGASVENEPHFYTPLSYAAYQGHDRIIRFLIERGARVNGDEQNGIVYVNTALMMAAMQGHESTTKLLLQAGADARIRVKDGHTASELARKNNHLRIESLLRCAEREVVAAVAVAHRC